MGISMLNRRFAPVAPPHLLRKLKETSPDCFGDYHLVLAHDIVKNPSKYEGLFGPECLVIIDNSIIEEGTSVDVATIAMASRVIGPCHQILVLPEILKDPYNTMMTAFTGLEDLLKYEHSGKLGTQDEFHLGYMLVLQGEHMKDISWMIDKYRETSLLSDNVTMLGIPRYMTKPIGSRMPVILEVRKKLLSQPLHSRMQFYGRIFMHLLGFSDSVADDVICTRERDVVGIDSAVPLRLGQRGVKIDLKYDGDQAGPRGTYWEDPHEEVTKETLQNIGMIDVKINGTDYSNYIPKINPTAV